jgi:hypothetical protein
MAWALWGHIIPQDMDPDYKAKVFWITDETPKKHKAKNSRKSARAEATSASGTDGSRKEKILEEGKRLRSQQVNDLVTQHAAFNNSYHQYIAYQSALSSYNSTMNTLAKKKNSPLKIQQ